MLFKVDKISGKGLSTNDLTNTLLSNYNAAYNHSLVDHAPSNAQKNSDITKAEIEAKLTGSITTHTHSYAGASSAGGAATSANKVNTNLVIKLNSGTTEDSNQFTFNGSTAKTINITPGTIGASVTGHTHDDRYYTESEVDTKLAGKADNEHGTHVAYGTSTTSLTEGGTGVVGTSGSVARADHTHTLTAYPTTLKNPKSVIVQLNGGSTEGTDKFTYDGSGAKTINITASSVGAAPSSHTSDTTVHITATERSTWNAKASTATATTSANGLMSSTDKSKLDGIASGANKYTHPSTHAATMIVEDEDHRFVTDDNIADWNAKSELVLGETSGTAYRGDRGKTAYDHSQSDHNFAGSSSKGGAATSANKVNSSLTIKLNGGTTTDSDMFTFNGSASKTIDITPAAIGASASGHNHDDKYFTESEINTKVTTLEGKITTAQSDAQAYAKTYTDIAVAGLLDTAPEALNTLNELAAALGDDPNFSTTIMTEIGKKADSSHGNHVPTTQTANDAVFLRNDNTWQTITPANIGAAKASHGTHVTYSSTAPAANGTASAGSAKNVSRGDHVHPLQTSVSGNAGSADKVNQSMVVKLNGGTTEGTNMFTFDGSAAKSINITPDAIGAAASSHGTHLTLGTGSGNAFRGDYGNTAYNHSQAAHAPSNAQKNSDITKAEIEAKLTGAITSHTHSYAGSSSAGGAATSANKVNSSMIVKLNGGTTEGTNMFTFDGSAAKTINITPSAIGAAGSSHGTHVEFDSANTPKAAGTAAFGTSTKVARADHVHPAQTSVSGSSGSCTGNAASATKLQTARDITIGNQTQSFNGTAAISFDLASIGVEQISDEEVESIISTVFGA